MKNIFIINPTSGRGKANQYIPIIKDYFTTHEGDYDIIITKYPKHATEIAASFHKEDDVILYGCGGDGTITEILAGINEGVRLCVIPGGTGNDFYKTVDLRKLTDEEVIAQSIEGEDICIDYGIFNNSVKFINTVSFGVDADIDAYTNEVAKKKTNIPNKYLYLYAALKVGLHPEAFEMEATIDGETFKQSAFMFGVFNGRNYGGMFKPAPHADLQDGKFDCVTVGDVKFMRLLYLLFLYSKGKHVGKKDVYTYNGQVIDLKFDRTLNVQYDGETASVSEVHIEVVKNGLLYRAPRARKL